MEFPYRKGYLVETVHTRFCRLILIKLWLVQNWVVYLRKLRTLKNWFQILKTQKFIWRNMYLQILFHGYLRWKIFYTLLGSTMCGAHKVLRKRSSKTEADRYFIPGRKLFFQNLCGQVHCTRSELVHDWWMFVIFTCIWLYTIHVCKPYGIWFWC